MPTPRSPELPHPDATRELLEIVAALLAETTGPAVDVDGVMRAVCTHAQRVTRADGAVVEIASGDELIYRVATGSLIAYEGLQIPQRGSLSGLALQSHSVELCVDSELDPRVNLEACRRVGARSMALVPLLTGDVVVGVLKVASPVPAAFGPGEVASLQLLAGVLAFCIQRAHDIEAQREAERGLVEREAWFRTLIESASDMIGVLTLNGVYTYCSPSVYEQLGYAPEQLVGRSAFEIIHHDDAPRVLEELGLMLRTPPHRAAMHMRVRSVSGAWRECDVRLRKVLDAGGTPLLVANSRDVTDSTRMQRQVEEAERMVALGRVASSMAHEFNNVLMGIQPHVELLARVRDEAKVQKSSQLIQSAVARGKGITQQILRLSREDPPNRRRTAVRDVLASLQSEVVAAMPSGVRLAVDCEQELYVLAEAGQIEQILFNLCLNARDAMPGGGVIAIAATRTESDASRFAPARRHAGGFARITVSDTGVGIAPELTERVFEPLFTTKKGGGGTGLGLPIARQIAEAHHGELAVESRPGGGTTFTLYLPLAKTSTTHDVQPDERDALPPVERLLLVEDDELVAAGLIAALEASSVAVHHVSAGGAASAAVTAFEPDVVVLDYGLPDMKGTDVFRVLRRRWPDLVAIFATGHADAALVREEVGLQDVEICAKPFSLPELFAAIERAKIHTGPRG